MVAESPGTKSGYNEASRLRPTHLDDASLVFTWRRRPLSASIQDATVSLDASSLLLPYTVSAESLQQIEGVLAGLAQNSRLVITGQAAREYAKNRVKKITEVESRVAALLSRIKLDSLPNHPVLRGNAAFDAASSDFKLAQSSVEAYKSSLKELLENVRELAITDPVSEMYGAVFNKPGVVVDPLFHEEEFLREASERKLRKIPPGYKDSHKEDEGVGDLLIWKTLLRNAEGAGRDLVFVTSDEKSDWWHRADGSVVYPRYELIDEYRRVSCGGSLHLVSFSQFLKRFASVTQVALDEVQRSEESPFGDSVTGGSGNVLLQDHHFLFVVGEAGIGAIRPLRQTSMEAGGSAECSVWFIPMGYEKRALFDDNNAITQMVSENSNRAPRFRVGPYSVEWSVGGDGAGWFYSYGEASVGAGKPFQLVEVDASTLEEARLLADMF